MSEDSLTYRDSGVDVEANLEANRRIQQYIRRTHNESVLTRSGLFGGAIRLGHLPEALGRTALVGRLITTEGDSPENAGRRITRTCRSRSSAAEYPLAFLDYLAAARLDANRAADLVEIFSGSFESPPKIPIIGGETAEMPDVFRSGAWEVVGALFAVTGAHSAAGSTVSLNKLEEFEQPTLVFSMDGVGTKTKLGVTTRRTSGLALDIIHHSLNDILCQGARGLAVMLYMGCHRRDDQLIEPLRATAADCCRDNGLVLLDFAICEKPNLYLPGEIDVCGVVVGAVDAAGVLQGDAIQTGDILVGLSSSGLHTNGYSLARKALLERGELRLDQFIDELGCSLADALLEPHRNYAPAILPLLADRELGLAIRGIAHITGGGLKDNLERILPGTVRAEIQIGSWRPPSIFELIRRCGNIPLQDPVGKGMYESFNMGIGLVLVVAPEYSRRILEQLRVGGHPAVVIGQVVAPAATDASGVSRIGDESLDPARRIDRVRLL
ncbi:MAG: phosphoribosylformylglycinamidine cyclo-ligase [Spirochaetaceae bacterium]|nr:MAG: phosphoribosylformylglycinamidine cyclo-ligase [Spirochaetaceae bacterium]